MSHIFDALQKLQVEKTAKLKQSAITGGMLLDAGTPRRRQTKRYVVISIAAAVVLIGVVAFWITQRPNQQAQPKAPLQTVQQTVAVQQPAAVVTPPPPAAPQPLQTAPAAQPAAQPVAANVPAQPSPDEDEEDRPHRREKQTAKFATAVPVPPPPARPVAVGTPEGIKLSGIAWHDNRKLRRAVINDLLVGEGAEVAGARIVEIRTSLVKIEKNGMLYEVVLPH